MRMLILSILIFAVGFAAGGYVFFDTQSRNFLTVENCKEESCIEESELLGLLASIGLQKIPDAVPTVIMETDKNVVVEHPYKVAPTHFVVFPKRDMKDPSDLSLEDQEYVMDAYAVIGELIRENDLDRYQVYTNGPGYQHVNYLHFHLISQE